MVVGVQMDQSETLTQMNFCFADFASLLWCLMVAALQWQVEVAGMLD
jgi:hypothetical protein